MPIVTQDLINEGLSLRGALNSAQIRVLMPNEVFYDGGFPKKGWKSRLIGSQVTKEQMNEFLRLKNRHLAHKSRDIPNQRTFESELHPHMDSMRQEMRRGKRLIG